MPPNASRPGRRALEESPMSISESFTVFMREAPEHAAAWMQAAQALDAASALDKKTEELAYVAVLAAVGGTTGIPFHVKSARAAGASRAEVISSVLLGLPAVGAAAVRSLPAALEAYDAPDQP